MFVELEVLPVLAPPFPAVPDLEEPVLTPLEEVVLAVVQLRREDEWIPWWSNGGMHDGLSTPHPPRTTCSRTQSRLVLGPGKK